MICNIHEKGNRVKSANTIKDLVLIEDGYIMPNPWGITAFPPNGHRYSTIGQTGFGVGAWVGANVTQAATESGLSNASIDFSKYKRMKVTYAYYGSVNTAYGHVYAFLGIGPVDFNSRVLYLADTRTIYNGEQEIDLTNRNDVQPLSLYARAGKANPMGGDATIQFIIKKLELFVK